MTINTRRELEAVGKKRPTHLALTTLREERTDYLDLLEPETRKRVLEAREKARKEGRK